MNISKATEQYRKNYFARAFKSATRYGSSILAVKTADAYLVSDTYLLLRVGHNMAFKLDWLRSVNDETVKLKCDADNVPWDRSLAEQYQEWSDRAQTPVYLTNTLYDLDGLMVRVLVSETGERFFMDAEKMRLLGENYASLTEYNYSIYSEPGHPTHLVARDASGTAHAIFIPLISHNNFATIAKQQEPTTHENVA